MHTPPATRPPQAPEILAALATGGLMTFMLLTNSTLAAHTTPVFSSLAAHGVGTLAAVLALAVLRLRSGALAGHAGHGRAPLWAYLGGISGAVTVAVTSAAANSALALTGTLALGLAGQAVLALVCDRFGLLGLPRRPLHRADVLSLVLIGAGTLLVVFARGAAE